MEAKKTPKADLENKRTIFLEIGLSVSLLVVLLAFEWSSSDTGVKIDQSQIQQVKMEEEIVPITNPEEIKAPEPPKVKSVADVIKVVDDNIEVDADMDIFDSDFDEDAKIEIQEFLGDEEEEEEEQEAFVVVEDMPTFGKGGIDEFRINHVQKKMKYPEAAAENNIQGRVYINFVVNEKGEVCNVRVVRGVDPLLDKEAVRVVSASPKWKPGKQRGKPVRVQYTIPIIFMLQ